MRPVSRRTGAAPTNDRMTTDTGTGGPDQPAERGGAAEPRCAHCGALLAAGIGWCAQCYTPIVAAGAERPAGSASPEDPESAVATVPPEASDVPERGALVGAVLDEEAAAKADQMLALLAIQATSGPGSGRGALASLSSVLSNTGARMTAMVAGTLVLSLVGFGLFTLVGQLL